MKTSTLFSVLLFNPRRSKEFLCGLQPDLPASAAPNQPLTIALKQVTITSACSFNEVPSMTSVYRYIGWRWAGFDTRGAAEVSSIKGGQGLPHARHSQFQPVPVDPPQSIAETISQAGSDSLKTDLRWGRKCQSKEGGGNKKVEKQQREH